LKIGQHLAKLEAKIQWFLFSGHGVYEISYSITEQSPFPSANYITSLSCKKVQRA